MLNQGFILCLSFTMIVGITLFLFVNQKIKKLDKSVDTMIELIYGYSKELNTYKENITNLMEKKEYSTGSSSEPTSEPESPRVHEVYGSNPSKKIYINGNGITSVINEPTFGITFQNQDIDGQIESDDRVVVSDDEVEYEDDEEDEADQNNDVEFNHLITKSSLYDDVLNKITKNTEELVDTKPRIVKLDFEESTKSLLGEHNMRSNSNSESESDSELELEQKQVVEPENEYIDYSKLSVNKLKSVLKEKNYHGIRSVNKMKKQELISALENINNKNSNVNEEDEDGKEDENVNENVNEHDNVNEDEDEHEHEHEHENVNQSMKNTINNIFKTNETMSLDQSVGKSFLIEDEVEEGNENGGETEIENIEIAKQ